MQEKCNNRIVKLFQYVGASSSKGRQGKVLVSNLQLGRLHTTNKRTDAWWDIFMI